MHKYVIFVHIGCLHFDFEISRSIKKIDKFSFRSLLENQLFVSRTSRTIKHSAYPNRNFEGEESRSAIQDRGRLIESEDKKKKRILWIKFRDKQNRENDLRKRGGERKKHFHPLLRK